MDPMTLLDGPLVGFDTETTGVRVAQDRIVTAALVTLGPEGQSRRTWIIDPGIEIPLQATAVHGISTEYARSHGMDPRAALEQIATALAAALNSNTPVVAFNASYDLDILAAELERYQLPSLQQRCGGPLSPVIDPLVLDRAVDRYRRGKRTLGDLCAVYGVTGEADLHAADVDVIATLDILAAIVTRYPHLGQMTLDQLHTYQVAEHRKWAEHFNNWLRSKGKVPDATTSWPTSS